MLTGLCLSNIWYHRRLLCTVLFTIRSQFLRVIFKASYTRRISAVYLSGFRTDSPKNVDNSPIDFAWRRWWAVHIGAIIAVIRLAYEIVRFKETIIFLSAIQQHVTDAAITPNLTRFFELWQDFVEIIPMKQQQQQQQKSNFCGAIIPLSLLIASSNVCWLGQSMKA